MQLHERAVDALVEGEHDGLHWALEDGHERDAQRGHGA
jgi:hypothetical protein